MFFSIVELLVVKSAFLIVPCGFRTHLFDRFCTYGGVLNLPYCTAQTFIKIIWTKSSHKLDAITESYLRGADLPLISLGANQRFQCPVTQNQRVTQPIAA